MSKALVSNWDVLSVKARSSSDPVARRRPKQGTTSWRSFLTTIWAVWVWERNSSTHLKRVSLKTSKYFILPQQAGSWGSQFSQGLWGYRVSHLDPFLGKSFGFPSAQSCGLAETSQVTLSSLGMTYLGLSNSESFVDPRWVAWWRFYPPVLPVVSRRMIFPSDIIQQPVCLSCCSFLLSGILEIRCSSQISVSHKELFYF